MEENKMKNIFESERDIENIFVPHNIEGRDEQRLQMIKRKLNKKIINGDLILSGLPSTDLGNVEFINGDLDLYENNTLKSLGKLKRVEGGLNLEGTSIEDLGDLEYVGGYFFVNNNKSLKSLGKLKYIGEDFDMSSTEIEDLGELEYIGGENIWINGSKFSKQHSKEELKIIFDILEKRTK